MQTIQTKMKMIKVNARFIFFESVKNTAVSILLLARFKLLLLRLKHRKSTMHILSQSNVVIGFFFPGKNTITLHHTSLLGQGATC